MKKLKLLCVIVSTVFLSSFFYTSGMVFDNRFVPLLWHPYVTVDGRPSHVRLEFFGFTGKRAYDQHKDEMLLPAIYGTYDLGDLARALVDCGCPNPLRDEWQGASIPWNINGKLEGEGFTFSYHQAVTNWFSFGLNSFVMNLHSWHEFFLEWDKVSLLLSPSDCLELDETRRCIHKNIGLCGDHFHHVGVGDVDFYLRFGYAWDYIFKFRHISAGARVGMIFPSARMQDEHYAASIPFGGNGHWGMYGAIDAEFELKEDWKAGLFFWLGKRFAKSQNRRVPVRCEPQPYGATCADVFVNPGLTLACSPYISFENLRDGFGLRGQYTLTKHFHDTWKTSCRTKLEKVSKLTAWGSDYFSVAAFYDFGKMHVERNWYPIVTLTWDIPAAVFVAERSAKTQKISLGVEWNY